VPRAALDALEEGRPGITTGQLSDVARALSLDPGALLSGRDLAKPVPSVFLRHAPRQDFDERDWRILDDALEQGRALSGLRILLGDPTEALQAPEFVYRAAASDRAEAPAQEGYRLARSVRRWLENTSEPLGDMGAMLEERFGIAILVRGLATSRATAASIRSGNAAAIVLNSDDVQRAANPLLARVHLAHELCHVLFDPSTDGLNIVIDVDADRQAHAAEKRARAFAAELLLPLEGLIQLIGEPRGVSETSAALELIARVRRHFGTSHPITANHLCNRNFIELRLRDWLEAADTLFGRQPPPTSLPANGASSRLVASSVERAYREGYLTDGEARSMLGIDELAPLPWDQVAL
jgi:Zn-dependent peptidase ImmA (M78 family)